MVMQDYYVQEEDSDDHEAVDSSDTDNDDDEDGCPAGNYLSFDDEMKLERKRRLPSLCSATADGMGDKPQMKSEVGDEELFYDPEADDADEEWIERKRKEYLRLGDNGPCTSSSKLSGQRIKNSDAVLNCPSCMTLLCLDCQRHETYKTQYRAMFVQSCTADFGQELLMPQTESLKQGAKKKRKVRKKRQEKSDDTSDELTEEAASVNKKYYSVKCDICCTQVAVYDQDEVYHFFNVLASHS